MYGGTMLLLNHSLLQTVGYLPHLITDPGQGEHEVTQNSVPENHLKKI